MRLFTALSISLLVLTAPAAAQTASQPNISDSASSAQIIKDRSAWAKNECSKQLATQENQTTDFTGTAVRYCIMEIASMAHARYGMPASDFEQEMPDSPSAADVAPAAITIGSSDNAQACKNLLAKEDVARVSADYNTLLKVCLKHTDGDSHFVKEFVSQKESIRDAMRICELDATDKARTAKTGFDFLNTAMSYAVSGNVYGMYAAVSESSDCLTAELR